jgi:uncharacterized protein YcsI (UPF0317 family)
MTAIAPRVERDEVAALKPSELRRLIRDGRWDRATIGLALGYTQANLAIVPREYAFDFMCFCQRNPRPCPVLEVTDPGDPEPRRYAPGADLRTDLPRYRVFRDGECVDEPTDIGAYWRDDLVGFLIGCSLSFEAAMLRANIPLRHLEAGTEVPAYVTGLELDSAGPFRGRMVVSMRPIPPDQVSRAVQVTSRFPATHGAPVHVGDPSAIGIADIHRPEFGNPPDIHPGDVPIFWGCGITPQNAALNAKLPLMITHAGGHMFVTDVPDEVTAAL